MTDTSYARPGRLPISRSEEWWHLAAALLGLVFGNLCLRWSPMLAFEASVAMAVFLICIARPFAGVLMTLGLALSLEQYAVITGGTTQLNGFTLALGKDFFANLNTLVKAPWLYLNAMEVLLLISFLSWTVQAFRQRRLRWRGGALAAPLLLMLLTMLAAVGHGMASGGDGRIAMWEIRAFLQLGLAYFVAAHMVENRAQVRAILWTVIGALLFRALLALWNASVVLHFSLDRVEAVTPHEDALFFASLIALWALLKLYRAEPAQRRTLGLFFLGVIVALIVSKRRAGLMALAVSLPYLLALLDWRRMKKALVALFIACVPATLLTFAFWNNTGTLGMPARTIRAVIGAQQSARDEASDRFRVLESHILAADIRANPFLGMGFGQPYRGNVQDTGDLTAREADKEMPTLDFELARYVSHNQILWIWVKAGLIGFVAFWFFITLAMSYGTRLACSLKDPYFRAIAGSIVLLIGMQMVVSFVDQELTSYRNAAYLGMMLGMLTRLRTIEKQEG